MTFLAQLDLKYGNLQSHYRTEITKPVHFAAQFDLSKVVEILLEEMGPEPYSDIFLTLEILCRRGYPRIVRQLINRVNEKSILRALLEPCERGNDEVAEILIIELGKITPAVEFPPELLCKSARKGLIAARWTAHHLQHYTTAYGTSIPIWPNTSLIDLSLLIARMKKAIPLCSLPWNAGSLLS